MRGAMKPAGAHLGEIQTYLGVCSFQRGDYRGIARVAIEAATGTDRGDLIVFAMIEHLRERESCCLPPLPVRGFRPAFPGRGFPAFPSVGR
jgi:hypothetical protein